MRPLHGSCRRQVLDDSPQVLAQALEDDVNLAVWHRRLPAQIEDFSNLVLGLEHCLSDDRIIEVSDERAPVLDGLFGTAADVHGYEAFIADVTWLVAAFTCLLDARRVGVRIRVLESSMCPRFHVDHVPLRLLTTYSGDGSQWLAAPKPEQNGGAVSAELEMEQVNCLQVGDVALLKGERWIGNEGHGLVHRSPPSRPGARRLLLSLDWLG